MPIVRIEHAVPSFEKWKQAWASVRGPEGSGVRRYQILRLQDDPNYAFDRPEFDRPMRRKVPARAADLGRPGQVVMHTRAGGLPMSSKPEL